MNFLGKARLALVMVTLFNGANVLLAESSTDRSTDSTDRSADSSADRDSGCRAKQIGETIVVQGGTRTNAAQISPNGKCVAVTNWSNVSSLDGRVSLFRFNDKCCSLESEPFQHFSVPQAFLTAYSPNGKFLAVSDIAQTVYMFKVNQKCCKVDETPVFKTTIAPSSVEPFSMTFSPDSKCLAISLFRVGEVILYRVHKNGHLEQTDTHNFGSNALGVASSFSPNGNCLACCTATQVVMLKIDKCTCKFLPNPQVNPSPGVPNFVAFSPDGKYIAVTHQSGTISIYSIEDCLATLVQDNVPSGAFASGVVYSQDGRCLIVANLLAQTITVYDVARHTGKIELRQTINVATSRFPSMLSLKKRCFVVAEDFNNSISSYQLESCHSAD